ncbi:MAG: RNA polymerase sigma factor [Clostridia bacterium]|nr:RNA polymerase sigma factor [Clostridia bacterium]
MNRRQFDAELEIVYDELYRFIYSIIGNKSASDDVIMNTILAGLKNFRSLKSDEKFKSWIFTIGKHLCFSHLQKYGREVSVESFEEYIDNDVIDVESLIIDSENKSRVLQYIDELDENEKELLKHRYYYELTFDEIAKAMGININTAKTWHRRALLTLKQKFEKE